jgi:hypothetical protein
VTRKPYKARSLKAAEKEVERLRGCLREAMAMIDQHTKESKLMAMLAADAPQFYNPLHVYEAKKLRDEILSR